MITLDTAGSIVAVVHDDQPQQSYLTTGGRPEVSIGGAPLRWPAPEVLADTDEVEFGFERGPVRAVVRHSFAAGWGVRVALSNVTDEPVELDDAALRWACDPSRPAWALAAGATGAYAVPSADGDGPLLGGLLALGSFERATPDTLGFGRITLAPRGRFVVQWIWAWYRTGHDFARGRQLEVPRTLFLQPEDAVVIEADEDTAVVLANGLGADRHDGQTEILCGAPGRFAVEVTSARGSTRYDLFVAESYAATLNQACAEALQVPATPAGIVALRDVHAALAVQQALRIGQVDDPYAAEDALDLFMARALDQPAGDPLLISFACTEAERTGAAEPIETATRWLHDHEELVPGLGIAVSQLSLVRLVRGQPVQPLVEWLTGLGPSAAPGPLGAAMLLERSALSARRRTPNTSDQVRDAIEVGHWLGAGLKGLAVRPRSAADLAYLATVIGLTDEELTKSLRRHWGCTAAELGHRVESQVLYAMGAEPCGPALSWLILAARTAGGS